MTLGQILTILRARWFSALAVLFALVAATVAASLLMPKQFTATAAVFVDMKSPDPIMGVALANITVPGYMASQVDLIQSERVALRAIRALRLNEDAELRKKWQLATEGRGDFEAWLAETLQKKLDVRPSREGNVIALAYTAADPGLAAALANAFVQGYIDTTLELRVEPAKLYNSYFDDRAKQLRAALEDVQAKLSDYQRSKGITANDERLDIENARLNELSTQLVALQAVADESGSRQVQANSNGDRLQEVLNNPVVANLTTDLSRQEARLFELSERLGEQHPQVKELSANIAQVRSRIQAESRRVSGSVGVNNSVNQSRVAQLRSALAEQRAKVLRLKSQRDEAGVLQRDVENAHRAYDAVQARANQSSLESQNTQTNVSVLKRATEPAQPSSPKLVLNTALAVFVGALLAVGFALARELFDRRLRTEEDVTLGLDQLLLVQLPPMRLNGEVADATRTKLLSTRVLTGLPRPAAR